MPEKFYNALKSDFIAALRLIYPSLHNSPSWR